MLGLVGLEGDYILEKEYNLCLNLVGSCRVPPILVTSTTQLSCLFRQVYWVLILILILCLFFFLNKDVVMIKVVNRIAHQLIMLNLALHSPHSFILLGVTTFILICPFNKLFYLKKITTYKFLMDVNLYYLINDIDLFIIILKSIIIF